MLHCRQLSRLARTPFTLASPSSTCARSRRSFHLEDLPEIMSRCKAASIRGYPTLNTLLYDHDLKLCYELLETAKAHGVDAVIAADIACIQLHGHGRRDRPIAQAGQQLRLLSQRSLPRFEKSLQPRPLLRLLSRPPARLVWGLWFQGHTPENLCRRNDTLLLENWSRRNQSLTRDRAWQ